MDSWGVNRLMFHSSLGCFELEGADRLAGSEQVMFQSRVTRMRRASEPRKRRMCLLGAIRRAPSSSPGSQALSFAGSKSLPACSAP